MNITDNKYIDMSAEEALELASKLINMVQHANKYTYCVDSIPVVHIDSDSSNAKSATLNITVRENT